MVHLNRVLPIRKIAPTIVALTSYYGKNFVARSPKKANSSAAWLVSQINKGGLIEGGHISEVAPANVFNNNFEAPFIYNMLAYTYKSLKAGNLYLTFDHQQRETLVSEDVLKSLEVDGSRLVGLTTAKEPIVIDVGNTFHFLRDGALVQIGDIYQILQLPMVQAPVDFSEVRVYSKTVPVGIVMGYLIGFSSLLKLLKVPYRVEEGKRVSGLLQHEYVVSFKDKHYVFSRHDTTASLIIGGYLDYDKVIRGYDVKEFDKKDVYVNLLYSKGITSHYVRELEISDQLFVDPITKGVLEDMNEPVTFRGLLIRATEMLDTYHHPDTQDTSVMRIRGYERISGFIYKELSASIKAFKNRNISGRSKIDMSPYQVWTKIMDDQSLKLPEDTNPIQNLKESEVVTYVGEGGRSKDTMTKASRAFHTNDIGMISEATVDSSDVGINTFMSPDPNFKNLRGLPDPSKPVSTTSRISTSALLSPGSMFDDTKRVVFISIQNSHVIATEGYRQPYLRTGYEYVIGHRTSDMFCYTAKQDGTVSARNKLGIIIQYADGETKGIALGRQYGKAEGSVYPHDIVSHMKVGDTFKKGQVIAYNTGFFERDYLDPQSIVMKSTMLAKVVLWESNQTLEDSSSISKNLAAKLTTRTTKTKSITVTFKQNVLDVMPVGAAVHPKDVLLVIEDEITSNLGYFDDESLSVLRKLSKQAPSSKYEGKIDKIEVYYHGSKDDMSPSLRALVDQSDKALADKAKATGRPVLSGQVNSDYRVDGVPLAPDKAEIKYYITVETKAGVGDKGIFASQMKSVIGEVMNYSMYTEDGDEIDAVFGYRSISARIVTSPILMGTTITLLRKIAKQAVTIYKG